MLLLLSATALFLLCLTSNAAAHEVEHKIVWFYDQIESCLWEWLQAEKKIKEQI